MAFNKENSRESVEFKQSFYAGIGSFKVLGVNPTNAEKAKWYGRDENDTTDDEEPVYASTDDNGVNKCRLDFYLQATVGNEDFINKVSIFAEDRDHISRDGSKKAIIDCFGLNQWATLDEIANKQIPTYIDKKTGEKVPFTIDKNYRVAKVGEIQLINLLICQLNLASPIVKKDGKYVITENPADRKKADAVLETPWAEICKGNIAEIKDILTYQPENKIKAVVGVKTTNDKQYQDIYNKEFWKTNTKDLVKKVKYSVNNAQQVGSYPNTEFSFEELHKIENPTVTATEFNENSSPWGSN